VCEILYTDAGLFGSIPDLPIGLGFFNKPLRTLLKNSLESNFNCNTEAIR